MFQLIFSGLSEVMESLQIGNVHEELHAGEEMVDGHDHRRRRSADDDATFQKASWVWYKFVYCQCKLLDVMSFIP